MTFEQILYDVADGVCTVTLHRPDRLNAVTSRMMRELLEAFDETDADDAVRAVIVTGSRARLLRRRRSLGAAARPSTTASHAADWQRIVTAAAW